MEQFYLNQIDIAYLLLTRQKKHKVWVILERYRDTASKWKKKTVSCESQHISLTFGKLFISSFYCTIKTFGIRIITFQNQPYRLPCGWIFTMTVCAVFEILAHFRKFYELCRVFGLIAKYFSRPYTKNIRFWCIGQI